MEEKLISLGKHKLSLADFKFFMALGNPELKVLRDFTIFPLDEYIERNEFLEEEHAFGVISFFMLLGCFTIENNRITKFKAERYIAADDFDPPVDDEDQYNDGDLELLSDAVEEFALRVPEALGLLSNLQSLTLCDFKFKELPETLGNLRKLTSLTLEDIPLHSLPSSIGNMVSLESFSCFNVPLRSFPDSFASLPKLISFRMKFSDKCLSEHPLPEFHFPSNFGNLPALQSIFIRQGNIPSFPESFSNLSKLKSLSVVQSKLHRLCSSVAQLKSLEKLELIDTELTHLPGDFGGLSQLRQLLLSKNKLTSLPDSFHNLSKVENIDLSYNKLERLPLVMTNLNSLKTFNLSYNQILSLPEQFQLKSIKILDCSYNHLSKNIGQISNFIPFFCFLAVFPELVTASATFVDFVASLRPSNFPNPLAIAPISSIFELAPMNFLICRPMNP